MTEQGLKKLKKLQVRNETDKRVRVLCVEDVEVVRDTMAQLLEYHGYKVASAKNGKEGVEMARQWKPDLVLMDLRMPVMDGFNAIYEIKFNAQTSHIPVFVVSAWSSKRERDKAKLAGADEFFVKPPDIDRLSQAIKSAVAASG